MCGIFGVFNPGGLRDDLDALVKGIDIVAHRGPDGQGVTWFGTKAGASKARNIMRGQWTADVPPTLLLCHRRLSIVDLSELGAQPMTISDGDLWITYNGELYNFVELRVELEALGASFKSNSDTEVVLQAYRYWGLDAVNRFVGMWAFALLDLRTRQLVLSRDRFGVKPLYYCKHGDRFAFASEIKQLLTLPGAPRRVNDRVIYDYLQYEANDLGTETFFESIRRVQPGHHLVVSLDRAEIREIRYYELAVEREGVDPANAAERFRALLKESVRVHLRSDVPVGTCLSGGLDSSSIAMLMREVADDGGLEMKRHAFNCHFNIPEADELEYTKASISAAGVVPHIVEPKDSDLIADLRKLVWHQDEPFGSTSIYAQWSVFRLIQQTGIKVVLDGQGADEMLGGYASCVPYAFAELIAKGRMLRALCESWQWSRLQGKPWRSPVPLPRLRRLFTVLSGAAPVVAEPWLAPDFTATHAASSVYVSSTQHRQFGGNDHFANVLYRFFFLNNLPTLLRYEDRNSMAFSVEARVPFLDHRLVEYAFSLPSDLKFQGGYTKRIMRDAMTGTLPETVRMRARKMGFATPERKWLAGPLRPLVLDALESSRLRPYLRAAQARQHFDSVIRGDLLSFAPWRWLNLHLWLEEFNLA